ALLAPNRICRGGPAAGIVVFPRAGAAAVSLRPASYRGRPGTRLDRHALAAPGVFRRLVARPARDAGFAHVMCADFYRPLRRGSGLPSRRVDYRTPQVPDLRLAPGLEFSRLPAGPAANGSRRQPELDGPALGRGHCVRKCLGIAGGCAADHTAFPTHGRGWGNAPGGGIGTFMLIIAIAAGWLKISGGSTGPESLQNASCAYALVAWFVARGRSSFLRGA